MRRWIVLLCFFGAAAVCQAQQYGASTQIASPITDHFAINGGYFWGHISTFGRFDSSAGVAGTPFTAEGDLGLPDQTKQGRVELMFRIRERSRLRLDFLDISRRASKQLNRTINYGDKTFAVNDIVQSELDWRQMSFNYSYSFLRADRYELALGLGLHLLQAEALGNVPARQGARVDFSGAGPIVAPGLDGTWRIARRFALSGRAQYFHLTVNGIGGVLADYHADLQYRWRPNFALGAGYESAHVQLDVSNRNPSGIMRMVITGPELFLRASF